MDPRLQPVVSYVLCAGSSGSDTGEVQIREDVRMDHRAVFARHAAVPRHR